MHTSFYGSIFSFLLGKNLGVKIARSKGVCMCNFIRNCLFPKLKWKWKTSVMICYVEYK